MIEIIRHKGKRIRVRDLSFTFKASDDNAAVMRAMRILNTLGQTVQTIHSVEQK